MEGPPSSGVRAAGGRVQFSNFVDFNANGSKIHAVFTMVVMLMYFAPIKHICTITSI